MYLAQSASFLFILYTEYEYNPEFFLVQGLSCPLFTQALKHGLFPTAITLLLSPVDDFSDYIKFVTRQIPGQDFGEVLVGEIVKKLGIDMPASTGQTLISLRKCPTYILLLYSALSSREQSDSRAIQGYFQGRFAGKCRVAALDVEPRDFSEASEVQDRIVQFFRKKGVMSASQASLASSTTRQGSSMKTNPREMGGKLRNGVKGSPMPQSINNSFGRVNNFIEEVEDTPVETTANLQNESWTKKREDKTDEDEETTPRDLDVYFKTTESTRIVPTSRRVHETVDQSEQSLNALISELEDM
jgi:hypothetical protein